MADTGVASPSEVGGSFLVGGLAQAFKNILRLEIDRDAIREFKENKKKEKSKKKNKGNEKEDKPSKEIEEKQIVREGNNSFITHPTASSFAIFSHVRHLVLQQQLCETFNYRNKELLRDPKDSDEEDEEEEGEKDKQQKLPKVVTVGIRGVFVILQEIWHTVPELCVKVLNEFLNIVQGQVPAGLKNEPPETTSALFELLVKMVSSGSHTDSPISLELVSVASSCLISLVIALGETDKLLEAISALLIASPDLSNSSLKIPIIFRSLQASVEAVLLGSVAEPDWIHKGVLEKSLIDSWPLGEPVPNDVTVSMATDSTYLYIHGPFGLMKVGLGYGTTTKGQVYERVADFYNSVYGRLMLLSDKLLFHVIGEEKVLVLNPENLKMEKEMEIGSDVTSIGPSMCLFSDGKELQQIVANKEGGFSLCQLTTLCSPIPLVDKQSLDLMQKSILSVGKTRYNPESTLYTLYQNNSVETKSMIAHKTFTAVLTSAGQLFYQGSGSVFGITDKDVPKGEWKKVPMPSSVTAFTQIKVDHTGSFCLATTEQGAVYFAGINRKGESGQNPGKQAPPAVEFRKVTKLNDKTIISCGGGTQQSAFIDKEGKLYLFGQVDEDILDKQTSVVTGLNGVPISEVAMGRSHICVLTQLGTVYTFGNNQYGQCGRNYIPPEEGQDVELEDGDDESEESEEEEEPEFDMCPPGEHDWSISRCMICKNCSFCTGYGPTCCNEGLPGREPGEDCGCGSGDAGCLICGFCKVCTGDSASWSGGMSFYDLESEDPDVYELIMKTRTFYDKDEDEDDENDDGDKKKKKKGGKKGKKDKEKGNMGLQLLFGGKGESDEEEKEEGSPQTEEEKKAAEKMSTKKPGLLLLPDDNTVMQVECGLSHSVVLLHNGEVYAFGNNSHGQLGQGNKKHCGHPVKVPLPDTAKQISCGDFHTVVVLSNGEVFTFGKYEEGQLGRHSTKLEDDNSAWSYTPGPMDIQTDSSKVKWVYSTGCQTFVTVDESLISESCLPTCKVFANRQFIGVVPMSTKERPKPSVVMINRSNMTATKMDSADQADLSDCALCVDSEYSMLWAYNTRKGVLSCYNPTASEVKDSAGTILVPPLCLPQSKEATISRHHAGLNLLSCLYTASTNPPPSVQSVSNMSTRTYNVDEYKVVNRFNSCSGSWGYSDGSKEAIKFSCDQDILLGGFGVYSGSSKFSATIKVYDISSSSDEESTSSSNMIGSGEEKNFSGTNKSKTYRILLEKPVLLVADKWYSVVVSITSNSGASTAAGSSGMNQVTAEQDKAVFKFKNSKHSDNSTDVTGGQIPEILYRSPEVEKESGLSIQIIDKRFSSSVTFNGLQALQAVLEWGWENCQRDPNNETMRMVVKNTLGIMSSHIKEVYPAKGINKRCPPDCPELAEAVFNSLGLIKRIFSSPRSLPTDTPTSSNFNTMNQCKEAFTSCFHAFYPSATLKWFALCHLLHSMDPSDIIVGFPGDNLLSAVLEALSTHEYGYIGLSYETPASLALALENVADNCRFPILTEFMHQKTKEEFSFGEELMTFKAVSTKLLSLISASLRMELSGEPVPCAEVVSKASEFLLSRFNELALCSSYPSIAAYSGLPISNSKRKEKLWETSVRFPSREMGHPELISNDVSFSVNKPVTMHGFGVYGDTENEYTYTISLLKDGDTVASGTGSFSASDCIGEARVANLMFTNSYKLVQNVVYIARVSLKGKAFTVGTEGKQSVIGQGGVVFTLHSTGLDESNPENGPLAKFLCSSITAPPQTVVQLSVHMASVLLNLTVGFLTRVLQAGPTLEALKALSSSHLMSKLLPSVLAQLGTIASQQPESSVTVLEMIKQTLPIISAVVKSFKEFTDPDSNFTGNENLDSKLLHYANVETDHPYKPATVSHYKVKFPEQVKWLTLEFDPKSGFAQPEDKLMNILIPRDISSKDEVKDNNDEDDSNSTDPVITPMIGVNFEDIYSNFQNFGVSTPAGLIVLPGNEVHIVIGTDTEYEKKDKTNHYGIKCKVIGYEWSDNAQQCLAVLEKELVTLGAMCSGALLSEDLNLPFAEELPVVPDSTDGEKADMRIVQAAAQEVLSKHCNVLGCGLYSDPPTVPSVLKGDFTTIVDSPEQQFLQDFIKSKSDSSGGRLARWLQPDRSVDPDASVIDISTPSEDMQVGRKIECSVCTKDQNGKTVFVKGMMVEVKCEWKGQTVQEKGSIVDGIDSVLGVRKPVFARQFTPTSLGLTNVYQTISMMMPYSDYSFEELRCYAPKVIGSVESMNVVCNEDGTYAVNWVPSTSGTYNIRICIDGTLSGEGKTIEVAPKEAPVVTEKPPEPLEEDSHSEEEKVVVEVIKRKKFPIGKAPGLRIRQEPSLTASSVGIIKPGNEFVYTEEVENQAGKWAKLSHMALQQFNCTKPEGYALVYSKDRDLTLLEEMASEEIKHVIGETVSFKKRKGGPGTYTVVHCGAAGHNIRAKPGMKGIPVGRLAKGSSVEVDEEVENDDGIWLKLAPSSAKSFCDSSEEAWTLVVHPSGRIFLSKEGDNSYKAFEPQPSSMQVASFPSAASVFGTQESSTTSAASVFGFNPSGIPPPPAPVASIFGSSKPTDGKGSSVTPPTQFSFGKLKLSFGETNGGKKDGKPPPVFQFTSNQSNKDGSDSSSKQSKPEGGSLFSMGVSDSSKVKQKPASEPSSKSGDEKPSEKKLLQNSILSSSSLTKVQALSPAVAECQRAIFAAFLWQENLVHDAMAAALHLKVHPSITKETRLDMTKKEQGEPPKKEGGESPEDEREDAGTGEGDEGQSPSAQNLPPTINHLVTFWDEIASQVISSSNIAFPPPKIPDLAQELQQMYDEEKKEMEKLKKEKNKKAGGGGGGGTTTCELCDQSFPDPVTYHMREAHPGCRKHASGWGYNSRGTFCSGWAGNCGDGGRGGSTWYLMCKDCHSKYLQQKEETKKKTPKQIVLPKMKCRKPGKPRSLRAISTVQGMILNAKFLLDISSNADTTVKKISTPSLQQQVVVEDKSSSLPRKSQGEVHEAPIPVVQPKPPLFFRSMSVAQPKRIHSDSSDDIIDLPLPLTRQATHEPTAVVDKSSSESSGLMMKPSMALAKLMYQRSRKGLESKDTGYNRVLDFVQRYHDLEGLRVSMKQSMRVAVLRSFALEFLEWLLYQVSVPSVVHDVLWYFMAAISNHPMIIAANQLKENNDDEEKQSPDWSLGKHPLTGLEGAGSSLSMLRKKFHSLLQTIANIMNKLPVGSSAQQIALKCWCMKFQPQDQSFLLQSRVFANISDTLSSMEGTEGDKVQQRNEKIKSSVNLMVNCINDGKLKVSANDAMSHSLTDGSTETFWECRNKLSTITVRYDKPRTLAGACVHIDNQKDAGQRVDGVSVSVSGPDVGTSIVDKCDLMTTHSGWKFLTIPSDKLYDCVTFSIKGSGNTVRVRQVMVLGTPDKPVPGACMRADVAMLKDCEAEALRLFRLLTAQVFGGLLNEEVKEEEDETDSAGEEGEDGDQPSSMANILFNNKSVLSGLQRSVCLHVIESVHTEAEKIKTEWETGVKEGGVVSKPTPSRQASHDLSDGSKVKGGVDSYCHELLTMLSGLSQNELGCTFLAEHSQLIKDLVSLLHTASTRIQLKICDLLRHILPYIKPKDFAIMLGVTTLPPLGYSAIAEAVNSAGTVNQLGILDCFLAVISKGLSVQVKAKGRGSNILQTLTGESTISAVTLAGLKNPKTITGEGVVKTQRWYLKGTVGQDIAAEVMKLLRDMTKGDLKGQWKDYAKSAIGQAVLHVTKISDEARNADPGMYSQTIWLCLAALCVIDEEHAEALSSGQWLGHDGQPQHKPLCDNHDDGETKALILCEECGNLCGECDRVLHYHKKKSSHQRQVFKEEEEAVKVDLHEGCGRIKLYWTMALADSRTLKGMVEFKDTVGGGGGKAICRFCGLSSTPGLLPIGDVCSDPECQERANTVCEKTLSCGHHCCGVKGETKCLPCLHGCGDKEGTKGDHPPLKQDADDMCMICYTEGLSCAPCIQLECGHVFHYHCCHNALTKKWSGPRITFRFMFCSICEKNPIAHPQLTDISSPLIELYEDVKRKCLLRLEYENQTKCEAVTSPTSKFYQKPQEYAMWKYAYYVCHKCKKAYYGGEAHCAEAAGNDEYDPTELVCPACSHTGEVQICAKHGTDFLEYKCRYCCSVAVYFCFGTTHFCNPCHDDFQRVTSIPKSELPMCPVGPRSKPLSGTECPLHVKHPPTGEEFALGCGVCRNAQTF